MPRRNRRASAISSSRGVLRSSGRRSAIGGCGLSPGGLLAPVGRAYGKYDRSMGALGDLLALVHDATDRARPATLTVVEWTHAARASEAFAALHERAARDGVFRRAGGRAEPSNPTRRRGRRRSPTSAPTVSGRSPPASRRAEGSSSGTVSGGSRGTPRGARSRATSSSEGGAPAPAYGFLLDPVGVVGELRLEPLGRGEQAGRPARARPRRAARRPGSGRERC